MNLGVVLLPLRVFLGFISIYAGMGKLCDPVYFDGGKRGSMVKWLNTLHPWEVAEPLRQFALAAPGRLRTGHRLRAGHRRRPDGPGLLAARRRRLRRPALGRAAGHRQLEERPRLRDPRHHLPRRLVPADHRRRPRLLRRRPPRRQRLAPPRPPRRHLGPAPLRAAPRRPRHGHRHRHSPCSSARCSAVRSVTPTGSSSRAPARPRATNCPAPRSRGEPGKRQDKRTPSASTSPTQGATAGSASPSAGTTTTAGRHPRHAAPSPAVRPARPRAPRARPRPSSPPRPARHRAPPPAPRPAAPRRAAPARPAAAGDDSSDRPRPGGRPAGLHSAGRSDGGPRQP